MVTLTGPCAVEWVFPVPLSGPRALQKGFQEVFVAWEFRTRRCFSRDCEGLTLKAVSAAGRAARALDRRPVRLDGDTTSVVTEGAQRGDIFEWLAGT